MVQRLYTDEELMQLRSTPKRVSNSHSRWLEKGHEHGDIFFQAHIHRATEKAIAAGMKVEREAEETRRYTTLEGALACLIDDFHVVGLNAVHDQPRLL